MDLPVRTFGSNRVDQAQGVTAPLVSSSPITNGEHCLSREADGPPPRSAGHVVVHVDGDNDKDLTIKKRYTAATPTTNLLFGESNEIAGLFLAPVTTIEPTEAPLNVTEHIDGSAGNLFFQCLGYVLTWCCILFPLGVYYGCYFRQNCDSTSFANYTTVGFVGALVSGFITTVLVLIVIWSFYRVARSPPGPPPTFFREAYFRETAKRAFVLECRRREFTILSKLVRQGIDEENAAKGARGDEKGNGGRSTTSDSDRNTSCVNHGNGTSLVGELSSSSASVDLQKLLQTLKLAEVDPVSPCLPLHKLTPESEARINWSDPFSPVYKKLIHPRFFDQKPLRRSNSATVTAKRQNCSNGPSSSSAQQQQPSARSLLELALYSERELIIEGGNHQPALAEEASSSSSTLPPPPPRTQIQEEQGSSSNDAPRPRHSPNSSPPPLPFATPPAAAGAGGGVPQSPAIQSPTAFNPQFFFSSDFRMSDSVLGVGASVCVPCSEADRCCGSSQESKLYRVVNTEENTCNVTSSPLPSAESSTWTCFAKRKIPSAIRYGGHALGGIAPLKEPLLAISSSVQAPSPSKTSYGNALSTDLPIAAAGPVIKWSLVHHCHTCRQCVYALDHHCPWIGQCIGRENHKFFIQFLGYTSVGALVAMASMARDIFSGDGNIGIGLGITSPKNGRQSAVNACTWLMIIAFVFEAVFFLMLFPFFITSIDSAARGDTKLEKMIRARKRLVSSSHSRRRDGTAESNDIDDRYRFGCDDNPLGAYSSDDQMIDTETEHQQRKGGKIIGDGNTGTCTNTSNIGNEKGIDGSRVVVEISDSNEDEPFSWQSNIGMIFGPEKLQPYGFWSWFVPTTPILDMRRDYIFWRRALSDNASQRLSYQAPRR